MNIRPYDTDKSIATYYVVPVRRKMRPVEPPLEHAQLCEYYRYTEKETWHSVDPKQIVANKHSNYVCLVQLTDIAGGPKPKEDMDFERDVKLYAAVAATLTGDDSGPITDLVLANFSEWQNFPHGRESILRPTLMIPVTPDSTRGIVLIFTVTGETGKASPGLRSTFDPEIRGSTN
jgi:hypothetical protein